MTDIKRYDLVVHRITGSPGTSHNDNGKVCFYDDHAAIVAELEANIRINQQARGELLVRAIKAEEELARRDALEPPESNLPH